MRADLASIWSPSNKTGNKRRILARASVQISEKNASSDNDDGVDIDENLKSMKVKLIQNICCFFGCLMTSRIIPWGIGARVEHHKMFISFSLKINNSSRDCIGKNGTFPLMLHSIWGYS